MRVPDQQRRSFRLRAWIIAFVVILIVLLFSLRGLASFYTDYLWFHSLGQGGTWRELLGAKVVPAVVFTAVFFVLILSSLLIADRLAPKVRATGPASPEDELVNRYRQATGRFQGRIRVRRVGVLRADRRDRRLVAVAELDPLHSPRELRDQGPAVPQGRRLLRLPAALHPVHPGLALRRARDHPAGDRRRALPKRRDPVPDAGAAGDPTGEGAPVGDPRRDGAREDRRSTTSRASRSRCRRGAASTARRTPT